MYPWLQDIVQGTFLDTYKNLTYKSVMGQHWVSTYCQVRVSNVHVYKEKDLILTHVVKSVSILFEFPRGADYQNSNHLYVYNSWLCSLNSYVCHFCFFGPNIGQKHLKQGLKRLGLVWYNSVVILSNPEMSKTQKKLLQYPKQWL